MSVPAFGSSRRMPSPSRRCRSPGRCFRFWASVPNLITGVGGRDVEVDGGRAQVPAPGADLVHHDRGLGDAEPGPPVRLGDHEPQPAGFREGLDELLVLRLFVLLEPVVHREAPDSAATSLRMISCDSVSAKSMSVALPGAARTSGFDPTPGRPARRWLPGASPPGSSTPWKRLRPSRTISAPSMTSPAGTSP